MTLPVPTWTCSPAELAARREATTVLDLRPAEDFAVGHIEGARHVDLYGISLSDTSEAPLAAFLSIFRTLLGARGVRADRPVVVYDHESGERAARAVWMLAVLGHADVRLLDGGTQAWVAAGHPLVRLKAAPEHADPAKAPPTPPPFKAPLHMEFLATRFDVLAAIGDATQVLVDVRRESEYRGSEKRARRAGTIPGAVHVFWREHLDARGAYRPLDDIRALYASCGITPDKRVIAICHGGYRSASTFIALKSLEFPDVRNYVGSWAEWGNRDDTPVVLP